MGEVTLELYKAEERRMAVESSRKGLTVHVAVSVAVVVLLVVLNVVVAPEFPWAIFPALGMGVGVFVHWYFGVRHGDDVMRDHQDDVERHARRAA